MAQTGVDKIKRTYRREAPPIPPHRNVLCGGDGEGRREWAEIKELNCPIYREAKT